MIIKLLFAAIILFVLWSGIRYVKRLPPKQKKQTTIKITLFALIGVILLGVITGRMHWLGAAIAALIPLLRFGSAAAFRILPMWINRGGVIPIKTPYLHAKVQLKTGQVEGTILQGQWKGQELSSLTEEELSLFEEQLQDVDLKAYYLIKHMRTRSNQQNQSNPPPDFSNQDYQEALQTLGLTGNPSRKDIITAHRRLINKLHPDRGGSDFLAARVNQARDVLLKNIGD